MLVPIRIYRNLHKNCWSIQFKTEKGWRVQRYCWDLVVSDPSYKVYLSGHRRMLNEGVRNVHAYILGNIMYYSVDQKGISLDKYHKTPIKYDRQNGCFIPKLNKNDFVQFTKIGAYRLRK